MGDFVPVPEVAEFVVVQDLFGENVINSFHIKKEGGWDTPSLGAMCQEVVEAWNDHTAGMQSTDIKYIIVRARDLTTQDGALAELNFPPNSGGDVALGSAPGNVAVVIKHTTGFAGRSRRGRTYLAGVPSQYIANNRIADVYANAYEALMDAFDAKINAAGATWGIVSRYSGYVQNPPKYKKVPIPRAVGLFTDIINNACDRKLASMRRRLAGRGS